MRRTVQLLLIACAILAVVSLASAYERRYDNTRPEDGYDCSAPVKLDRAGKMGRGPIEMPHPLPVLHATQQSPNLGKGGDLGGPVGIGPRGGGLTPVEKAEVSIRTVIRKLG